MLLAALLRTGLATLSIAALGCVSAGVADSRAEPPKADPAIYTITLSRGQPVLIPAESLTVELMEIKDGRCPAGAACIWAGHAAVTLQVSKPGSAVETVTIGTQAPPHMKLPFDATYGRYLFHLVELESGESQAASKAAIPFRATVSVSKL
jgi:hypothetical protein